MLQYIAKEIDLQKRKDDPEFKGAFHEKKFAIAAKLKAARGYQGGGSGGKSSGGKSAKQHSSRGGKKR